MDLFSCMKKTYHRGYDGERTRSKLYRNIDHVTIDHVTSLSSRSRVLEMVHQCLASAISRIELLRYSECPRFEMWSDDKFFSLQKEHNDNNNDVLPYCFRGIAGKKYLYVLYVIGTSIREGSYIGTALKRKCNCPVVLSSDTNNGFFVFFNCYFPSNWRGKSECRGHIF